MADTTDPTQCPAAPLRKPIPDGRHEWFLTNPARCGWCGARAVNDKDGRWVIVSPPVTTTRRKWEP